MQGRVSVGRNQIVSITEDDVKTVEPSKFRNDNIVFFWMCWIQRKELPNESSVHIFSTLFYTELAKEGYDGVAHWTTNRGINIFQNKLITIPINKQKHWSLCVVMNHCYIDYGGIKLHLDHFHVPG